MESLIKEELFQRLKNLKLPSNSDGTNSSIGVIYDKVQITVTIENCKSNSKEVQTMIDKEIRDNYNNVSVDFILP